jgi:hypothetical protein
VVEVTRQHHPSRPRRKTEFHRSPCGIGATGRSPTMSGQPRPHPTSAAATSPAVFPPAAPRGRCRLRSGSAEAAPRQTSLSAAGPESAVPPSWLIRPSALSSRPGRAGRWAAGSCPSTSCR